MKSFIKFADTLSASMGKAFSWCIVILWEELAMK